MLLLQFLKFESLQADTILYRKFTGKKGYFNDLGAFSVQFWLELGKINKNNNHTYCVSLH